MLSREQSLQRLRSAYGARDLTLYVGAGLSVGNGLPTWERLVLAMYFIAINQDELIGSSIFRNYLFAVAEWHLDLRHEPLEITARKIWNHYEDSNEFMQ